MSYKTAMQFPDHTRLSLVLRAADPAAAKEAQRALNELCQLYWEPVYACARRKGLSPEDAMDCTQEVFAQLSREALPTACINGTLKLRVLLQREVMDHISSRHQHAMRQKRGAGAEHVSWDLSGAEERYQAEDSISSPETVFNRQWARATLDRCMELLIREQKGKDIQPLLPFLNSSAEGDEDYEQAALALGQSQDTTRQQVHRLKNRYKDLLKLEVSRTLSSKSGSEPTAQEVLDELKALSAAL